MPGTKCIAISETRKTDVKSNEGISFGIQTVMFSTVFRFLLFGFGIFLKGEDLP